MNKLSDSVFCFIKARNADINEAAVTHTFQAERQSHTASTTHQSHSEAPHILNQQPPAFQLASGPTGSYAAYAMQPLPAFARSIPAGDINMQSLWSFNSDVPGLPVPLQLTSVPAHSPAMNLDVGNLHQMSDGTVRTSSGSEASSSTGTGLAGNCSGVA